MPDGLDHFDEQFSCQTIHNGPPEQGGAQTR
jgi:hypothetical protein